MPRPAMNPNARFADVKPIWEHAVANNGAIWHTDHPNEAIRMTMRLNMYRKVLRELSHDGYIYEDFFVVARKHCDITIKRRPEPRGYLTTLDGHQPLTPEQVNERAVKKIVDDYAPLDVEIEND